MFFRVTDRTKRLVQLFPCRGKSRLSHQQKSRRARHLEFKSAVGIGGDLLFQFQMVQPSLVTPILRCGGGYGAAGGVGDRPGKVELFRAGVRRPLNDSLQPFVCLGVCAKAQEHRSGTNQKELPCRFHEMMDYFSASSVNGLVSTWNGLKILTLPTNGR